MKTLLNTHALADALTAFEASLTPDEEPLTPDEEPLAPDKESPTPDQHGGINAAADCYRQSEKKAYFAVDLAAITELGARAHAQTFSQQFEIGRASCRERV